MPAEKHSISDTCIALRKRHPLYQINIAATIATKNESPVVAASAPAADSEDFLELVLVSVVELLPLLFEAFSRTALEIRDPALLALLEMPLDKEESALRIGLEVILSLDSLVLDAEIDSAVFPDTGMVEDGPSSELGLASARRKRAPWFGLSGIPPVFTFATRAEIRGANNAKIETVIEYFIIFWISGPSLGISSNRVKATDFILQKLICIGIAAVSH